jgi:hypothetical protein
MAAAKIQYTTLSNTLKTPMTRPAVANPRTRVCAFADERMDIDAVTTAASAKRGLGACHAMPPTTLGLEARTPKPPHPAIQLVIPSTRLAVASLSRGAAA